jgi:hypothetical protein
VSDEMKSRIEYPFVMIPTKIYEINLPPIELAVLTRIIFRAGKSSNCFESKASIATSCGISVRRLSDALMLLEDAKIIEIESGKNRGKTNRITVNEPAQWLSIMQKKTKPKEGCASDADLGRHHVPRGWAPRADITRSNELDPIERDPILVAAAEATALQTVSQGENSPPDPTLTNKTSDTWKAYAEWYERRYNVPPARNAKVNAQLKQFCERVGYEDAPKIITFYLLQNDYWYVKQMHTIGVALSEAEKLVAGFRRGSLTTKREADYIDKTSSKTSFIQQILEVRRQKAQKGGTDEQDN